MNTRGPVVLGTLIIALALTASAMVMADVRRSPQQEGALEFQRMVGGLGLGPAVDLSGCVFSFDPRLCDACSYHLGPMPAGEYFCAQHGCSVLYYPALSSPREP
jgi:hypothetical protein